MSNKVKVVVEGSSLTIVRTGKNTLQVGCPDLELLTEKLVHVGDSLTIEMPTFITERTLALEPTEMKVQAINKLAKALLKETT
jgi:hypothetical protein